MTLTTLMTTTVNAEQTGGNDYGGPVFSPKLKSVIGTADGTAANQADLVFSDERTVATGANDDLDLNGVLAGAFGATLAFVEIVSITVINAPISGAANTTDLTIGGGTNPFVGFLGGTIPTVGPLKPGAIFHIASADAAGLGAVAAGTADILRITNSSGASATYQIMIVGRSA